MRPTVLFFVYLGAALVVGALIAYPVYAAFGVLIDEPLYRFVTRAGMLVALLSAVFFLRYLSLNNTVALGYGTSRHAFISDLFKGLTAGITIMLPLVLALFALNVRSIDPQWVFSWPDLLIAALQALVIGLIVAVIEETFFRGAMFTAIIRTSGLWPAAISTSLLYAAVHFITTEYNVPANQVQWYDGLIVLAHCFEQFAQPAAILDSFLALFMVGFFLALVRARHGHIAHCIGLHTGWVLIIQLTKDVTVDNPNARFSYLTGDYDDVVGLLALALLTALTVVYYVVAMRGDQVTDLNNQ